MSQQALDQARAEMEVAAQKHALARSQQRIYGQEQAMAQAQLGLRTLRSPISGIVVERFSNVGERVEDRPVLRVASIDPLRVSLMVPITQYGQVKLGDNLTIHPELPGVGAVSATVQYVDKVVDAASNTFRVRLSLPNPDHALPAGLRCKADWPVASAGAPAKPSPSALPPAAKVSPMSKVVIHATPTLAWPSPPPVTSGGLKLALSLARVPTTPKRPSTVPQGTLVEAKAAQPISLRFSIALADAR